MTDIDELAKEFANRIGSPWGEGATYEPNRPKAAEEEYGDMQPNGNFSHLDDDDWQKFQDDLKALIQQAQVEAVEKARSNDPHKCEFGHTVYLHNTAYGWCCACEADIAFLNAQLSTPPKKERPHE